MPGIIVRVLIIMLGLFLATSIVPGVQIEGFGTFLLAAILLGIINAIVRPVALVLTLPITLVTLGLFLFVLNAAMFGLAAMFLDNFLISGFWAALFGSIIVGLTSTIASWYIGPKGRYEAYIVRRR
jgi:putative membrane protein